MNYGGFKKVQEDEEKAVLKHKNGSELRIAKKTLKPEHKKALEALPIYAAEGLDVPAKSEEQKPQQPSAPVNIYVGGNNQQPQQQAPPPVQTPPQPAPMPEQQPTLAPQAQREPNQLAQPAPEQPNQDVDTTIQPQQAEEASQPQQARAPQTAEEMMQYERQRFFEEDQRVKNDLNNGHINPETYQSLFAKKDTLGKIGTMFGLLVSGAGAGLTHTPNAVVTMMDQQIKNDLEAQEKSNENAQNYLRINQQMQRDQPAAQAFANMQMNRAALHSLVEMTQKLPVGSPQRAQWENALALLSKSVDSENYQIGDRLAIAKSLMHFGQGGAGAGSESAYRQQSQALNISGNEKLNTYRDARHVPGFGEASIEVPQEIRQELIAKKEYDQAAKNYIDFATKHKNNWANLNPKERLAVARQGAVLGAELQGKYRMKTHGGVYKQGEQEYIQKIIPDNAASWQASFNQLPKVQQTIDNNRIDTGNLTKGFGLPAPDWDQKTQEKKQKKTDSSGSEHKEGDTGTYGGKPVVFKNGKWAYR